VYASAKTRFTSDAIRRSIRIRDPDRHQNLIVCSVAHCQPSVKISCKSAWKFLRKVANRQPNKQGRLDILLGGGNNNSNVNIYNAVATTIAIVSVHPVHLINEDSAEAADPQSKPTAWAMRISLG